jgi:hypothetical protein
VWCDLALDVAGVGGGPVATCVVGVDASSGPLWALTWAAGQARLWLASLLVERLIDHARQLGGNAVLGVRFDSSDLGNGLAEIVAYGTAATVRPA